MANKFTTSVNIIRDSERELNYIPTPNAIRVVHQISNDFKMGVRSFNIIGSYGTGKSSLLWAIQQSLNNYKKHFEVNLLSDPKVEFINFIGEYRSLIQTFSEYFGVQDTRDTAKHIFSEIFNRYHDLGKGNRLLVLVVDEFGKFLEYAAQNNPGQELYFIQQLSEFVNNPDHNILLFTTVHQNFDAYAVSLDKVQAQEWTKVKGRFREIAFNEPIEQLLFLASEHLEQKESVKASLELIKDSIRLFTNAKAFHFQIDSLRGISEKLYPLEITAAYVVTSALQRYGQNERSLFSFLEANDVTGLNFHVRNSYDKREKQVPFYSIAHVYDYLTFNFYSFIYSRYNHDFTAWKTIKATIEKAESVFDRSTDDYVKIIKTIGLLNIFTLSGSLLNKEFLIKYASLALNIPNADALINELESRKIIWYRNYHNCYVLNEGTDLDIPLALIEAGNKVSEITDVTTLLKKNYQLPPIIAKEITYKKGTPRLFEYQISEQPIHSVPKGEIDGFINLIFNDRLSLEEVIKQSDGEQEAILYGYYTNSRTIKDLLFEIEKTKKVIQENRDDKVAVRELENIMRAQQALLNHRILNINKEVVWVFQGKEHVINTKKEFNKFLSKICETVYYQAPIFTNELVNKHKMSSQIYKAKKDFFKALTDHWDKPDLNFPTDKFPPEKTIYWALFKSNGIDLLDAIRVNNQNQFQALWQVSLAFLESAKSSRRKITELNDILSKRPFKLKLGLIEFWIPSFLFVHRDDFALFGPNGYIPALGDETMELMLKYPDEYEIKTFAVEGVKLDIFNSYRQFLNQDTTENFTNQSFIETIKPFLTFYRGLPEYSKHTKRLSKEAMSVRMAISKSKDPEQTFFEDFPLALGYNLHRLQSSQEDLQLYTSHLREAIRELRTCYDELVNRVELFILNELIGAEVPFEVYKQRLQNRFTKTKKHLLLPAQKTFIQRLDSQIDDRGAWINSIAQVFIGTSLQNMKSDEDEIILYDKFKTMIMDLDSLTNISKLDYSEETEEVTNLEIGSFIDGINKKTIRWPKSKQKEVQTLVEGMKTQLSTDKTLNLAALTDLLKHLLKND